MCIRDSLTMERNQERLRGRLRNSGDSRFQTILSLIHISEPTRLLSISYAVFCLKMKRRPPRSTRVRSSAASDVYKRQSHDGAKSRTLARASQKLRRFTLSNNPVSYTHLRAHETPEHLVCRLLLENETATTAIYTRKIVGSVRCV